ncbi:cupredoxin family copper-binding protein [soil metagenome]
MKRFIQSVRSAMARMILSRSVIVALILGPVTGVLLALGPLSAQDAKATITIDNFTFAPNELEIAAGTTVTWINHDDIPHSVVESDTKFRSKALDTDDAYSFTFTTAGTFRYFCGLHPHMVGKIVVKP